MNGIDYSGSGTNQEIDDQGSALPGYVPYLSLVFKMIATTVILLLSGWVVYTIKTTRRLHKPQYMFIANLLVAGMMTTLVTCLVPSIMIITFQMGVESSLACYVYQFRLISFYVNIISFVVVAADKAVAIRFPLKYKRMMTPRVVATVIGGEWLIASIPTAYAVFFNTDVVSYIPEYGACIFGRSSFIEAAITFIIPMAVVSILTIALNVHLTMKAYRVHRQIEKETRLSGQSENVSSLKKKQRNIRRNRKPIITLLVVILGSVLVSLLLTLIHHLGRVLIDSKGYQEFMEHVFVPNYSFVIRFFHPLVYGLYFKQVREPMMKHLKGIVKINKFNSVAPQP